MLTIDCSDSLHLCPSPAMQAKLRPVRYRTVTAVAGVGLVIACGGSGGGGGDSGLEATLSWSAPTFNIDGSALTDIAGYRVYYGTDPTSLDRLDTVDATVTSTSVRRLPPGTYHFAITTLNSEGAESHLSGVVSVTFR